MLVAKRHKLAYKARIYEEEWEWMIGNGRIDEDSERRTCEREASNMREARGRMNYTPSVSVLLSNTLTPAHHSAANCTAGNDAEDRAHFVPNTK